MRQLDLVIDRLAARGGIEKRLADSLEVASRYGDRVVKIQILDGNKTSSARELLFSLRFACAHCGTVDAGNDSEHVFFQQSPRSLSELQRSRRDHRGARQTKEGGPAKTAPLHARSVTAPASEKKARAVRIDGRNIAEIAAWPIGQAREFFSGLAFGEERKAVGQKIVDQIVRRLGVMAELGLGYLSLDRQTVTLSGGELQRVRLATQIGSAMAGVLYVLDEPSIGLHQKDNAKLLTLLKQLRDAGNTVLVVEHDRETMREADYLIDIGPGAGVQGGEVVAHGTPSEICRNERSRTGRYLSGIAKVPLPSKRRGGKDNFLTVRNADARNLKNLTVNIPIGAMTCVTGVSGAGKSTLVMDVLYPGVAARLQRRKTGAGANAAILGWENFDRVIGVDQSPIGRTARSNPATYTGLYDHLRELFAQLPEARVRGYESERFSFNASGGRCEAWAGRA